MTTLQPLTCTLNDASRATGISTRQLYRLIGQGRLKTTKLDRKRLVRVDSLRELVAADEPLPNRRTAQ